MVQGYVPPSSPRSQGVIASPNKAMSLSPSQQGQWTSVGSPRQAMQVQQGYEMREVSETKMVPMTETKMVAVPVVQQVPVQTVEIVQVPVQEVYYEAPPRVESPRPEVQVQVQEKIVYQVQEKIVYRDVEKIVEKIVEESPSHKAPCNVAPVLRGTPRPAG
jgi:hypothetical protein